MMRPDARHGKRTDVLRPVQARRRRRAISASVTDAATLALSDSAAPDIGMDTVRSQVSPTSRDRPASLRPEHDDDRVDRGLEIVE